MKRKTTKTTKKKKKNKKLTPLQQLERDAPAAAWVGVPVLQAHAWLLRKSYEAELALREAVGLN